MTVIKPAPNAHRTSSGSQSQNNHLSHSTAEGSSSSASSFSAAAAIIDPQLLREESLDQGVPRSPSSFIPVLNTMHSFTPPAMQQEDQVSDEEPMQSESSARRVEREGTYDIESAPASPPATLQTEGMHGQAHPPQEAAALNTQRSQTPAEFVVPTSTSRARGRQGPRRRVEESPEDRDRYERFHNRFVDLERAYLAIKEVYEELYGEDIIDEQQSSSSTIRTPSVEVVGDNRLEQQQRQRDEHQQQQQQRQRQRIRMTPLPQAEHVREFVGGIMGISTRSGRIQLSLGPSRFIPRNEQRPPPLRLSASPQVEVKTEECDIDLARDVQDDHSMEDESEEANWPHNNSYTDADVEVSSGDGKRAKRWRTPTPAPPRPRQSGSSPQAGPSSRPSASTSRASAPAASRVPQAPGASSESQPPPRTSVPRNRPQGRPYPPRSHRAPRAEESTYGPLSPPRRRARNSVEYPSMIYMHFDHVDHIHYNYPPETPRDDQDNDDTNMDGSEV